MGTLATLACQQIPPTEAALKTAGFGILGTSWLELTVMAMVVSLLILALIYMFGNFLRHQQLIAWTRFELFQVFATAMVVMIFIIVLFGACNFDMSILDKSVGSRYIDPLTGHGLNMFEVTDIYFAALRQLAYLLTDYMMIFGSTVAFLANVTWISNPIGVGSTETPLQSFGQLNNILFLLVSGFVISVMLQIMQQKMLEYIAVAVLWYMFPFGVFFRAFEPTRPFGGTLIGLSIALLFFYPLMLTLNDYVIYAPAASATSDLTAVLHNANSNTPNLQNGGNVLDQLPNLKDPTERNNLVSGLSGSMFFLLRPVSVYFFAAIILPVINFIVLVEITRALTRLLGEEIDVSNLTRLI